MTAHLRLPRAEDIYFALLPLRDEDGGSSIHSTLCKVWNSFD